MSTPTIEEMRTAASWLRSCAERDEDEAEWCNSVAAWLEAQGPRLTVGLPLYRSRDCAWIALEGLAAQTDAPPWELLVIEEDGDDALGAGGLAAFGPALREAGCVRVERLGLGSHLWLGLKWRAIADAAWGRWLLLQGGDDLSHPTRLAETWDAVQAHPSAGWLHYRRGVFCDVQTGECAEFDRRSYPNGEDRTGLSMAVRVDLVRRFPHMAFRPPHQHGVDGWLRSWAAWAARRYADEGALHCVELDSEAHRAGAVYCDGARAGHLSANRPTMYDAPPFARVPTTDAARALRARWSERAR